MNNRLLVTQIKDPNGNFISISYASQTTPSCNTGAGWVHLEASNSSITDTLGRVISFNYDICNNLVSITGPGFGGTSTRSSSSITSGGGVSNSFSGLTVENRPTRCIPSKLKHAYFPDTQTGYLFSYSAYGMIYNVSMRKQMSIDQYGVISDGTEKSYVNFNYPTAASSLTDAPAFTQRTESAGVPVAPSITTIRRGSTIGMCFTKTRRFDCTLTRADDPLPSLTVLLTLSGLNSYGWTHGNRLY